MFTGLIETVGVVQSLETDGPGKRLAIRSAAVFGDVSMGDSIAINGCCLTVVEHRGDVALFEAGEETLRRTNLGSLQTSSRVNLERSVRVGDRLGGHFVTGHVDCVGEIRSREDEGPWSTIWCSIPAEWSRHLASKGSIAVDGISLTLVEVTDEGFSVALIPHTLQNTNLHTCQVGRRVNIETDLLAKYVDRFLSGNDSG